MIVNIEEYKKHIKYFKKINNCPIEKIKVYLNGKQVDIDPQKREDFKFTGLSNKDFVSFFF